MTPSLAELEAAVRGTLERAGISHNAISWASPGGYCPSCEMADGFHDDGDCEIVASLAALSLLVARAREMEEAAHWTRRMLQALDAYWEHYEGLSNAKLRTVRSMSTGEDWWIRYERYRERVESAVLSGAGREKPA